MRVHEITWRHGNDYDAIMVCEHCEHIQRQRGLYADPFYAFKIIPKFHCDKCGLNALGEKVEV